MEVERKKSHENWIFYRSSSITLMIRALCSLSLDPMSLIQFWQLCKLFILDAHYIFVFSRSRLAVCVSAFAPSPCSAPFFLIFFWQWKSIWFCRVYAQDEITIGSCCTLKEYQMFNYMNRGLMPIIIEHLLPFDDDDGDGRDTRKEIDRMSMNEPIRLLFPAHIWACVCVFNFQTESIFLHFYREYLSQSNLIHNQQFFSSFHFRNRYRSIKGELIPMPYEIGRSQ